MSGFEATNPHFAAEVAEIYAKQGFMRTIGATLVDVTPGRVVAELTPSAAITQQHGLVHGAATAGLLDTVCGSAAYTLMPPGSEVLTVEYKVNFTAPARGDRFLAVGEVVRAGRTITVVRGTATAYIGETEKNVAELLATMMRVERV